MEVVSEIIPHWRYEDRIVRHVCVWPFDLDDDGLENTVDPDPLVAALTCYPAGWWNLCRGNGRKARCPSIRR